MKKLIAATRLCFNPEGGSSLDVTDVAFRECGKPLFSNTPVVVYNPDNAGSIIAAAILATEKQWSCFKAGEPLPVAEQYIWIDAHPNRKLFVDPTASKKSSHYLFVQGFHPMEAKLAVWGAFQNRYTDWVVAGEKPHAHEFLLETVLGTEFFERYCALVELAGKFYTKPTNMGIGKEEIFKEICPLACVYVNVVRAQYALQLGKAFEPAGIDKHDVTNYLTAIQAVKNHLKEMRIDTVTENREYVGDCCTTTICIDFWLVKRVVLFSYKYYMNMRITLSGMVVDTNVKKPPERFIDAVVVR